MTPLIAYIDLEVDKDGRIADIGCCRSDGREYHGKSVQQLYQLLEGVAFLCGHNIFQHDLKHLELPASIRIVDTLYFSPLLFPAKPYHALVKDYKLDPENSNNPYIDALKTKELLDDERAAFQKLDATLQYIFYALLHNQPQFAHFFELCGYQPPSNEIRSAIINRFHDRLCTNGILDELLQNRPVELAYVLSLINVNDRISVFPPWVLKTYPQVQTCFYLLRNKPCKQGCHWCSQKLDARKALKRWFHYDQFRSFDGVPLQENAVKAAIEGKSLLTIFPTGGGKSITFQLPALMAGEADRGLTVIISPLQSLMKDQVDNLEKAGITDAVTINGSQDPIERNKSVERVKEGGANLLYISPESLRSNTIERILQGRHIARFVIDEAHCFSAWGQDFRVDYLYIGDFIKKLQEWKNLDYTIPVSCFTATAKQQVIEDIRRYFKEKLNLTLELFTTKATRSNLQYEVLQSEDKYQQLRSLLDLHQCPTIVYVSRTQKAEDLAKKLTEDGFNANYYHGKMKSRERVEHQEAFINGRTNVMVATSAFGMGVDKSDVGMVIHYEISDSLENYIQEAGRAGRSENIMARCYVLYNEDDLNNHFSLHNQTKLTIKEINEVWNAIKQLTKFRNRLSRSALEIARNAGWDDEVEGIETRITTAIAALEDAGYVMRGNNAPRVFATGIMAKTAQQAIDKIEASPVLAGKEKEYATRIIKRLFSAKKSADAKEEEGETRVDYLADLLGLDQETVIRIVNLLKQEKILADTRDLKAFVKSNTRAKENTRERTARYIALEDFLLRHLKSQPVLLNLKDVNEKASVQLQHTYTPSYVKTILNFWEIQQWIKKKRDERDPNCYWVEPKLGVEQLKAKLERRKAFAGTIVKFLFEKAQQQNDNSSDEVLVDFSELEAAAYFKATNSLFPRDITLAEIEDTLFYLSHINAIHIEGGFMVVYQRLSVERKEKNSKKKYTKEDYAKLEEYYKNKIRQIHIVGEYAQRMIRNYKEALEFVNDYFQLEYSAFIKKYFPGRKAKDLELRLTKSKFEKLVGGLSLEQSKVVNDNESQYIVVAAGPGSGKTRVLVHKLASLLQLEDVKQDQLLMLTFSRAAASEFKSRLKQLVGASAAYYVPIKTFHSYCFDLLGKMGDVDKSDKIIEEATEKIRNEEVLANQVTKTVLVIDEAQDISAKEFELIKALVEKNEDMRVILVGDDDQNIYGFRGASSACMQWFLNEKKGCRYTLLDNYRSKEEVVHLSNQFVTSIQNRMKHEPILSKSGPGGTVLITRHRTDNMIIPLVHEFTNTKLSGSVAILTKTNEEAATITDLLKQKGIAAKLVQGNEGFNLGNMLELRYLTNQIVNVMPANPMVEPELFGNAVNNLRNRFAQSPNLNVVLNIIQKFQHEYGGRIYKTDWRQFLAESKLEDFYTGKSGIVQVATIHKAKGKEFDNVFLSLPNLYLNTEENKRLVYVAITRAKNLLSVHCNHDYLQQYSGPGIQYQVDNTTYEEPEYISLVLAMTDVWLSYADRFTIQQEVEKLLPGTALEINVAEAGCSYKGRPIARFSKSFREEFTQKINKGYQPISAMIRYIVFWKNESGKEIQIVLPEIRFQRKN